MATRSTIMVAIPENKRGSKFQFPKVKGQFATPEIVIPEDANFVEVYHHWDGYPDCLGASLISSENEFRDFDNIMTNIIAGGDMSHIGTPYHAWRNEDWDDVGPTFYTEMPDISEEYQYLFSLDNQWLVREEYGTYTEFTPVQDVIDEVED